ncbi:MAG: hypothetical protein E6H94_12950 [Chloroflexi bacterium]|nr:MAG: hypothetical protein E6H94_12950 [Chloroflexota bacterium]
MPPQKASKSAPKADASEKQKSKDRDWLTTGELAQREGPGSAAAEAELAEATTRPSLALPQPRGEDL